MAKEQRAMQSYWSSCCLSASKLSLQCGFTKAELRCNLTHTNAALRERSVRRHGYGSLETIGMTKPDNHGYSGKPLFRKLGLKPGMVCWPIHAPPHYFDLIQGATGVEYLTAAGPANIVHLFCSNRTALKDHYKVALENVVPKGMFWVSWPKKSSSKFVDLTEDGIRELILPTGWVDVKVCAVDQDWSGLKFLRRKA